VQFKLDFINALEAAFGDPIGLPTTRWSTFSVAQLKQIEVNLGIRYAELVQAAAPFPETAMPLDLRGRIAEIRSELDGLAAERRLRGALDYPQLKTFPSDLKLAEAFRNPVVANVVGGNPEVRAEYVLRTELRIRLAWNPSDPHLKFVDENLTQGKYARLIGEVREPPRGDRWPPREEPLDASNKPPDSAGDAVKGAAPPEGPLPPPSGRSVDELRAAAHAELDATERGDLRARAEARARQALHADYARRATATSLSDVQLSLQSMDDDELQKFGDDYSEWYRELVKAKVSGGANWHGEAELADARDWIDSINAELGMRGPPPPPRNARMANSIRAAGDSPELESFRDMAPLRLEQDRLAALQIEIDKSGALSNAALLDAFDRQSARELRTEIETVNQTLARIRAERDAALLSGRGFDGELAGRATVEAEEDLKTHAKSLRQRITQFARRSPKSAESLERVLIDPALLAPPPSSMAYSADRLEEIDFKVRMARGVNALPRAPPVEISMRSGVAESAKSAIRLPREAPGATGERTAAKLPFDSLFQGERAKSYAGLVEDIRSAPGGVIVDARLPPAIASKVTSARYDIDTGELSIAIAGRALKVAPAISPAVARAALAMVKDGRVAAADIRDPDLETKSLLRRMLPAKRQLQLTPAEAKSLTDELNRLRAANLHPALIDTSIGRDLISSDELIFSALRMGPVWRASDSVFDGVDARELRKAVEDDLKDLRSSTLTSEFKSILSALDPDVTIAADTMQLTFRLRYEVFELTESAPRRLIRVAEWFADNDAALQAAAPELRQLGSFAAAAAVFRSVIDAKQPNNFDALAAVGATAVTPRFLCRGEVPEDCQLPQIRALLE
jgi:hypothetical protein